jgi:hypothetical protein
MMDLAMWEQFAIQAIERGPDASFCMARMVWPHSRRCIVLVRVALGEF